MGNNLDYTTHRPRMPRFRENDGRIDWRQVADMFLPGDWWNSETNQWRPLGIASGVTGLPIEGAVAFGRGVGNAARSGANFLRGIGRDSSSPTGRGDRSWLGPTFAGPTNATRFNGDFAGQDVFGTRNPNALADLSQGPAQGFRMQGYQDPRPVPMRGGQGGYDGRSISLARGLGEGERRTADSIMADQMAFLENARTRGGSLMER